MTDGVDTIAADQARDEREAALARGDMDAARSADAAEREFLGGEVVMDDDDDAAEPESQGPPGASLDAYVPWDALTEAEQDSEFERVLARSDPEMARREDHLRKAGVAGF